MAKIDEAMVAILKAMPAVGKTRENEQQHYRFRGIDDIFNVLHPLMKAHGVFITTRTIGEPVFETRQNSSGRGLLNFTRMRAEYTFHAEDGSKTDPIITLGEGMDSGDKSSNKAMSAALKYALIQAFAIPTEEAKDPENDSPEPAPRASAPQQRPPQGSQQRPAPPPQQRPATPPQQRPTATRPAQPQGAKPQHPWREVSTPSGVLIGDMPALECADTEVMLARREERTENAETYRKFFLAATQYYISHSEDLELVEKLINTLDHDYQLPDEKLIVGVGRQRLELAKTQRPTRPAPAKS